MRVAAGVKKRRMKSGFHGLKKVFDRRNAVFKPFLGFFVALFRNLLEIIYKNDFFVRCLWTISKRWDILHFIKRKRLLLNRDFPFWESVIFYSDILSYVFRLYSFFPENDEIRKLRQRIL